MEENITIREAVDEINGYLDNVCNMEETTEDVVEEYYDDIDDNEDLLESYSAAFEDEDYIFEESAKGNALAKVKSCLRRGKGFISDYKRAVKKGEISKAKEALDRADRVYDEAMSAMNDLKPDTVGDAMLSSFVAFLQEIVRDTIIVLAGSAMAGGATYIGVQKDYNSDDPDKVASAATKMAKNAETAGNIIGGVAMVKILAATFKALGAVLNKLKNKENITPDDFDAVKSVTKDLIKKHKTVVSKLRANLSKVDAKSVKESVDDLKLRTYESVRHGLISAETGEEIMDVLESF
jgi:hypothetical protein